MPTISPTSSLMTTVAFSISSLANNPPLVLSTGFLEALSFLEPSLLSSIALLKPSVRLIFFSLTSRPDENPKSDFADSSLGFLGFAKIRLK